MAASTYDRASVMDYPAPLIGINSDGKLDLSRAYATGVAPYRLPTLGGSVPMHLFTDGGRTPVVGVPIVNHDNNQHGANENLRLANLWYAMDLCAALFTTGR